MIRFPALSEFILNFYYSTKLEKTHITFKPFFKNENFSVEMIALLQTREKLRLPNETERR